MRNRFELHAQESRPVRTCFQKGRVLESGSSTSNQAGSIAPIGSATGVLVLRKAP